MINAGDGVGEHPTQALLDIFTMHRELADHNLEGKIIALVGDLKNGRTVHSLAKLLTRYRNVTLHLISPDSLKMPADIIQEISTSDLTFAEYSTIDDTLARCDVMYVTRIQKERFCSSEAYESVKNAYYITRDTMAKAKTRWCSCIPYHALAK